MSDYGGIPPPPGLRSGSLHTQLYANNTLGFNSYSGNHNLGSSTSVDCNQVASGHATLSEIDNDRESGQEIDAKGSGADSDINFGLNDSGGDNSTLSCKNEPYNSMSIDPSATFSHALSQPQAQAQNAPFPSPSNLYLGTSSYLHPYRTIPTTTTTASTFPNPSHVVRQQQQQQQQPYCFPLYPHLSSSQPFEGETTADGVSRQNLMRPLQENFDHHHHHHHHPHPLPFGRTLIATKLQSTPSPTTIKPKRQRALYACERCKARKQKCDNALPRCSNCVRGKAECNTVNKAALLNSGLKEHIDNLERRCKDLQDQVKRLNDLNAQYHLAFKDQQFKLQRVPLLSTFHQVERLKERSTEFQQHSQERCSRDKRGMISTKPELPSETEFVDPKIYGGSNAGDLTLSL
ncbi:hypothetical protein IE53DRAFT_371833 [Violaceomyces palustris]|uniref:Uncharacterized protein n=1 Tax=Violaceomyces palustris TaxID=1673888 RepID=A0ACD0NMG7_9BASI|nr:hypothetical protein IE53DRAFT_371833 [Violaceomyces palustris]